MDVDSNAETSGNIAQFPDSIKTPEDFAEEFFIGNTEKTSCKLTTKGV